MLQVKLCNKTNMEEQGAVVHCNLHHDSHTMAVDNLNK